MSYCNSCPGLWGDPFPFCSETGNNTNCLFYDELDA